MPKNLILLFRARGHVCVCVCAYCYDLLCKTIISVKQQQRQKNTYVSHSLNASLKNMKCNGTRACVCVCVRDIFALPIFRCLFLFSLYASLSAPHSPSLLSERFCFEVMTRKRERGRWCQKGGGENAS